MEHFGLGRYDDQVDPDTCFKAMKAMQRVLNYSKTDFDNGHSLYHLGNFDYGIFILEKI